MNYYFLILSLIHMVKCDQEYLIIDGEVAEIEQFPHSAYLKLMINNEGKNIYSCGASIVNQRILLTAAHCVEHCTSQSFISVAVGSSNREKGLLSSVQSFITPPNYKNRSFDHDIALLKLTTDLKFSKRVQRVALMSDPPYHEKAQVAAWGQTTEAGKSTDKLRFMDQYVWDASDCINFLKTNYQVGVFCASSKTEVAGRSVRPPPSLAVLLCRRRCPLLAPDHGLCQGQRDSSLPPIAPMRTRQCSAQAGTPTPYAPPCLPGDPLCGDNRAFLPHESCSGTSRTSKWIRKMVIVILEEEYLPL